LGQLVGLQVPQIPFVQPAPEQLWQARPPLPQALSSLPSWQAPPAQHPFGHDVPSQTQAPATQCSPAPHGAPLPHWQVPVAEQLSVVVGSQATQATPPTPQVARPRGTHTPVAQHPAGHEVASHFADISRRHVAEQPSPDFVFPSSQSSSGARTTPSPQIAGAPSVSSALVSWSAVMATACCSLAAMVSPAMPSTRTRTDVPPSAAGRTMVPVSWPLVSGRGVLGSVPGANAAMPLSVVPEIASAVSPRDGS
jgi:hypothetical protein